MANRGIDFVLSLSATKFQAGLDAIAAKTKASGAAVESYWKKTETGAQRAGAAFSSMQSKVVGAVAAIGGIYLVKSTFDSVTAAAMEADKASFNLGSSIQAANREFNVGSSAAWANNIKQLTEELKIYSTQSVTQAVAKTIDMTKRLGLSEQQMLKVIRAAANLSAGKFDLSEGVERVTAALRGEAEASEALGLTLSETYVTGWYAAHRAHGPAWKSLNDLQKAQVRYQVLLEQSNPLLGKAAASAGLYSGALTLLGNSFGSVKTNLGETITHNKFFIEGLGKISAFLAGLNTDIEGNRTKWMEWSKQGALGAVDFAVAGVRAASSVYSAFNGVGGMLQGVTAKYYEMKAEFLSGAAAGAKWKDALGITSGEEKRLGDEAAAAAAKAESLRASAARSFAEMEAGSPKLNAAADGLKKFRDEMAKVNVEDLGAKAKVADQEIVKVGNKYIGVAKKINEEPLKPVVEIEQEAYSRSLALLQKAVENQAKAAKKANEHAARGASGSWAEAADVFASSWSRAIDAISSRLDGLRAKSASIDYSGTGASGSYRNGGAIGQYKIGGIIQGLANGGGVRNMLAGGHFPGFGGGDRRHVLAEDGEYMLDKYRVRDLSLATVRKLHRGDYGAVIADLATRMGLRIQGRLGYALGGMIGSLPGLPTLRMAAGGVVGGGATLSGDVVNINISVGGGRQVPVIGTRENARLLKREFERMAWRSST